MDFDCPPLRVSVMGMSSRALNTLHLFLQGPCKNCAVIVEDDSAQALIIDMDAVDHYQLLKEAKVRFPLRPLLLFAISDPNEADAIFVAKPIKLTMLLDAVSEAKLAIQFTGLEDKKENFLTERAEPNKHQAPLDAIGNNALSSTSMELDATCFEAFIGSSYNISHQDFLANDGKLYYVQKQYLLVYIISAVKKAREKNMVVRINTSWSAIYIFPVQRLIWIDEEEDIIRDYCITPLSDLEAQEKGKGAVTITYMRALSSPDFIPQEHGFSSDYFYHIESFIWMLALWTSAGRLPKGINIDEPIFLRNWPNLTRLIVTPHAMRISALLISQPRTLFNTASALQIELKYVLAFYSAAHAIGIAGQVKGRAEAFIAPAPVVRNKSSNLLQRLLNKLKGEAKDKVTS